MHRQKDDPALAGQLRSDNRDPMKASRLPVGSGMGPKAMQRSSRCTLRPMMLADNFEEKDGVDENKGERLEYDIEQLDYLCKKRSLGCGSL